MTNGKSSVFSVKMDSHSIERVRIMETSILINKFGANQNHAADSLFLRKHNNYYYTQMKLRLFDLIYYNICRTIFITINLERPAMINQHAFNFPSTVITYFADVIRIRMSALCCYHYLITI